MDATTPETWICVLMVKWLDQLWRDAASPTQDCSARSAKGNSGTFGPAPGRHQEARANPPLKPDRSHGTLSINRSTLDRWMNAGEDEGEHPIQDVGLGEAG